MRVGWRELQALSAWTVSPWMLTKQCQLDLLLPDTHVSDGALVSSCTGLRPHHVHQPGLPLSRSWLRWGSGPASSSGDIDGQGPCITFGAQQWLTPSICWHTMRGPRCSWAQHSPDWWGGRRCKPGLRAQQQAPREGPAVQPESASEPDTLQGSHRQQGGWGPAGLQEGRVRCWLTPLLPQAGSQLLGTSSQRFELFRREDEVVRMLIVLLASVPWPVSMLAVAPDRLQAAAMGSRSCSTA